MNRFLSLGSFLVAVTVLASCGGTSDLLHVPTAAEQAVPAGKVTTHALVTIVIPQSSPAARRLRHHYVSPATQSISIKVTSLGGVSKSFNADLTPTKNKSCKQGSSGVTCQLSMTLPTGRYDAAFATYDGPLVRKVPTGNELSANQSVPFTVRAKGNNNVRVSLDGIPASIAFIPSSNSTLLGNVTLGYSLERCAATAQHVSILSSDADGDFILGANAPSIELISGSSSLAVGTPPPSSPNNFTLTPPTAPNYAPGGSAVYLLAKAIPGSASGGTAVPLIVKITFSSDICGVFTEFAIPTVSSQPLGITTGPDGAIWFTEKASGKLARIPVTATASNPQITEYALPTSNAGPYDIKLGPDGALWFTEYYAGQIGRTTDGSSIEEFVVPTAGSFPRSIAVGSDGALWFAEYTGNKIGRIPATGPVVMTEYPVPTASSQPSGIVSGSDGALWFTESSGNKIGRIPTSGGPITEFPISTGHAAPYDLVSDPSGTIWFTEAGAYNVGKLPLSGSPVDEFPVPTFQGGYNDSYGMVVGPDGAVWFANLGANSIARIASDGTIEQFLIPTLNASPIFITVGPDGNLWFTEYLGNKIGELK